MKLTIKEIEEKIRPVLLKYGISSISVTGSVARGEETEGSDIDLIVEFNFAISLLAFARIKNELETVLGSEVDLMERSAIKPRIREYLLQDEVKLSI